MKSHEIFACLCVGDAAAAIAFYRDAFGATEKRRLVEPDGRVGHAELISGPTTIMLCGEFPQFGRRAPAAFGSTSATIHLHVHDAVTADAVAAGATLERAAQDLFDGERSDAGR